MGAPVSSGGVIQEDAARDGEGARVVMGLGAVRGHRAPGAAPVVESHMSDVPEGRGMPIDIIYAAVVLRGSCRFWHEQRGAALRDASHGLRIER